MRGEEGLGRAPPSTILTTCTPGHTPSPLSSLQSYGYDVIILFRTSSVYLSSPPSQVACCDYIAFLASTVLPGVNHHFVFFFCLLFCMDLFLKSSSHLLPCGLLFHLLGSISFPWRSVSQNFLTCSQWTTAPLAQWGLSPCATLILAIFFTSLVPGHPRFFFLGLLCLHSFLTQNFQQLHEKG